MNLYLAILLIFFLSSSVQGMTGFGSALVAMPLLSFFLDARTAVPLCALNSIVITGFLLYSMHQHLDVKKILPLCIAAIPGAILGAQVLRQIDAGTFKLILGLLLICYSSYTLIVSPLPRRLHPRWAYLAGFLSGSINSAFSTGGPPTILYATLNNWSKDEVKATLTGFFAFNSLLTVTTHYFLGFITRDVQFAFLASAGSVLLGTMTGSKLYSSVPHRVYLKITYLFLLIMGLTLAFAA